MSHAPDAALTGQSVPEAHQIINRQTLARIVGYLALLLPFVLLALGYAMSCAFDTISHYYYGPISGSVFVGTLAAVALALFAYSGKTRLETIMATFAALALIVVALVPTQNVGCEKAEIPVRVFASAELSDTRERVVLSPFLGGAVPDETGAVPVSAHFKWADGAALLHTVAAGVFIVILAYFCFAIFTKIDAAHLKPDGSGEITDEKRMRNRKYLQSGWVIVSCLVALGVGLLLKGEAAHAWDRYNGTFVFESTAILAFARSWLLKGRAILYSDLADENERQARMMCEGIPDLKA